MRVVSQGDKERWDNAERWLHVVFAHFSPFASDRIGAAEPLDWLKEVGGFNFKRAMEPL